jgi:hypothetical protein
MGRDGGGRTRVDSAGLRWVAGSALFPNSVVSQAELDAHDRRDVRLHAAMAEAILTATPGMIMAPPESAGSARSGHPRLRYPSLR